MSRAQSIEVNCSNRVAELAHETRHRYPAFLWYQVETQEQGDHVSAGNRLADCDGQPHLEPYALTETLYQAIHALAETKISLTQLYKELGCKIQ